MEVDTAGVTENLTKTINTVAQQDAERIFLAIAVLLIGIVLVRLAMRLANRLLKSATWMNATMHSVIRSTLKFLLYFLVVVVAAGMVGIPMTSFVALLSVAGIAVSLALQGLLSNIAGGFILLGTKPFEVGDYIEADGITGTVDEITFLHTRVIAIDGKTAFVPNSLLYTTRVVNGTTQGWRRVEIALSASYDNAPEEVRAAILDAVNAVSRAHPGCILADPAPKVVLDSYGDSAIAYAVYVFVKPGDFLTIKYALNEAIYSAFQRGGVEMTYPHLNVHMHEVRREDAT